MSQLLAQQLQGSPQRGLPVNDVGASSMVQTAAAETVQLYYYNISDVQTTDAGQVAGTVVVGKISRGDIKNQLGSMNATYLDTSLSFTSTALTTEVRFPFDKAESEDATKAAHRARYITEGFSNGQYCVDYTTGVIYGKKASTQTSLTNVTYLYASQVTGGGGPTADVNVNQWGGVATTLGQKVMASSVPVTIASNQSAIPTVSGAFTAIASGVMNVTNAGTAEPLVGAPTPASSVDITPLASNTGNNVYIGDSSVNGTTNPGITLTIGQVYSIAIDDLEKIYVDVDQNGDGVSFNYYA